MRHPATIQHTFRPYVKAHTAEKFCESFTQPCISQLVEQLEDESENMSDRHMDKLTLWKLHSGIVT